MADEKPQSKIDPRLDWLGVRVAVACKIKKDKQWDLKVALADEFRFVFSPARVHLLTVPQSHISSVL